MVIKQQNHTSPASDRFELKSFFPYQVRVFYTEVSSAVAAIYQKNYDISPAEWRCMAILNEDIKMTAADIVFESSMDKVTVSRAISKLRQKSWIIEAKSNIDRRSKMLELSEAGKTVLRDLVPKALKVEQELLKGISAQELKGFYNTLAKISENRARLPLSDKS